MESHCQRRPAAEPAVAAGLLDRRGHMTTHGYHVQSCHLYREIEIKKTTKITISFLAGQQLRSAHLTTFIDFRNQKLMVLTRMAGKRIFLYLHNKNSMLAYQDGCDGFS